MNHTSTSQYRRERHARVIAIFATTNCTGACASELRTAGSLVAIYLHGLEIMRQAVPSTKNVLLVHLRRVEIHELRCQVIVPVMRLLLLVIVLRFVIFDDDGGDVCWTSTLSSDNQIDRSIGTLSVGSPSSYAYARNTIKQTCNGDGGVVCKIGRDR